MIIIINIACYIFFYYQYAINFTYKQGLTMIYLKSNNLFNFLAIIAVQVVSSIAFGREGERIYCHFFQCVECDTIRPYVNFYCKFGGRCHEQRRPGLTTRYLIPNTYIILTEMAVFHPTFATITHVHFAAS